MYPDGFELKEMVLLEFDKVYSMTRNCSVLTPQSGQASIPFKELKVSPQSKQIQYCLGSASVSPFSNA